MKKHITIFVLITLVLSMIIPVFAADATVNNPIVTDTQSVRLQSSVSEQIKASKETLEIAENAVLKLSEEVVFSLGLDCSLEHMYNTAKWVEPDVKVLETKKDAALALIEIYEENLADARNYDFVSYNEFWKNAVEVANIEPSEINDSLKKGRYLLGKRETIEALLAVDCYYNLLDDSQFQRMLDDFDEFAHIDYSSCIKIYNDTTLFTYFERYRAERESGDNGADRDRSEISLYLNGIEYTNGTTINTTSGNSITTFYAQSQLSTSQINSFYNNYYGQSGYSDLTYVSSATSYYNCHAYAWYNTSPGIKWINNNITYNGTTYYGVERFIYDDHSTYLGSSDSSVQINDIIVYWVNGKAAHSGIVVGTNPIRIRSKWGQGCVWTHNKNTVPPAYKDSGIVNATYYRYSRSHSYQYVDYGNDYYHKHQCSVCGYYTLEPHHWVEYHVHPTKDNDGIRYIPEYHCSDCGAMTLNPPTWY